MQPWRRTDWTLPGCTAHAWRLEHNPRHSRQINAARVRHIERFPRKFVAAELDVVALLSPLVLLHQSRRLAARITAGHWTTAAIMHVTNQLARLRRIERRNAT